MLEIIGWQKNSFIDFPGTVSTVLFLSGCNLRCPYCHNPGVVFGEYEPVPFDDIKNYIIKRRGIIEGAVITGGEPSVHSGLRGLCDDLKTLGMRVKIDTNGLEPEEVIMCDFDYLALDIKTSLKKYGLLQAPYRDYRERLGQSVDIVKTMGDCAEIRITAAPGIIDREDIDSLCIELRGVKRLFIQQYEPAPRMLDPSYRTIKPYEPDELELWREKFLAAGIGCRIREVDV
ncbi:MAG: anaerobic ribonucleoside-triphosphate reductase activating protein [Chitinispirillia bacterium]|nr:anaerobic ribonucleoside-triphosphate reductase activating protein [Chitinispirillia bacterium]MCL2268756.1 anaerobic ribonucleoside-triphosphate reductase activating protein [Chitinispirillia bacterium]